jgi:hypothetical protein
MRVINANRKEGWMYSRLLSETDPRSALNSLVHASPRHPMTTSLKSTPMPEDNAIEKKNDNSSTTTPTDNSNNSMSEPEGTDGGWFTYALLGYVVFVIVDTVFHILPDKSYVQMAVDAIKGVSAP